MLKVMGYEKTVKTGEEIKDKIMAKSQYRIKN